MFRPEEATGLIGLGVLAKAVFQGADLSPLRARLLERVHRDQNDANALMDLSTVMHLTGHRDFGLSLQELALQVQQVFHLEAASSPPALRLLSISCPGDLAENNALEFLVDGSDVALDTLYVGPDLPLPESIPVHDVAMVAICESDRNQPFLQSVARLVRNWPRPVLCLPARIANLSRDAASMLLQGLSGIVMPPTRRLTRHALQRTALEFPVVARPLDSHKGQGLARLDDACGLANYLNERKETDFYVAPYVDFSGADGQYRKFRIIFIGGQPYVCHVAISSHWIVHYLSSGMVEDSAKRAEEAHCFETFDNQFARRHQHALRGICELVELEYFGIDCAETRDGRLLVFEVDSGMTVHAMDPVEIFPYKAPQMRKVFRAFRDLLETTIASACQRSL